MSSAESNGPLRDLPRDTWMSHLPRALWDLPLCNLAIPGSHNTVTYCLDKNDRSPVDLTQPDVLQKLDKYMKPLIRPFVYKWAITQESTVKEQLDCGVRYCDLRIAHRPNDNTSDLYFYHGVYTTVTVEAVLKEIREWLDSHPREVVILSFSHFQGLGPELHNHLVETIKNVFATKLCPKTETVTLRNLWHLGYQVIVSYEHNIKNCHNELWSHIPYWWANKCKAEALIEEFERRRRQSARPGGFFVTGINLTEDLKYICSHPTESLKDLVMSTYPVLLEWVEGSHDTMTYCLDLQSPVLPSQPLVLRLLDRAVPCITRPCLYKWGSAQVHNINEQLDAGIRYFDLRVAHKDSDSACTLYFAHGIYTLTTVMDALEEVFFWLKCHEKEVVILACSMFDGLKSEEHEQLIRFIANLFGKKMCPRKVAVDRASPPVTPSLRIMWDKGYQVIVSYDDDTGSDYEELWPKIPYWWANEVDPVKVIRFLEEQKQIGRPEGFFAAGLNLTEDAKYILTHPGQSLSSLTLESYATFLKWVEKQSPGPEKSCLNIICADFVGAARGNEAVPATNGFASAVIALNKKLLGKLRVQKS